MPPEITKIELTEFSFPLENIGPAPDASHATYRPGSTRDRALFATKITTNTGVTGEYVSQTSPPDSIIAQIDQIAPDLLGTNPLRREYIWDSLRRKLKRTDRLGIGPIDIALWDLAGHYHETPIHELIGTYRTALPAYASTALGDHTGGLDSPDAYADFAEQCHDIGYPAFKLHGWPATDTPPSVDMEVELIRTVGERIGDSMQLMYDPVGQLETFADALRVGRACDDYQYLWIEDPTRDFGTSQHASTRLKDLISTPLLQTEHVRGFESHTDFAVSHATDFLRADPEYDGGITGTLKIGHVAEGLGLDIELHLCGPAQRHCMACLRNSNYYEIGLAHPDHPVTHNPPIYEDDYDDSLTSISSAGTVTVPSDPGLGVTYNWDYISDHASAHTEYTA